MVKSKDKKDDDTDAAAAVEREDVNINLNCNKLARNILHRLSAEFFADEMTGKLEILITDMLLEEIDRYHIIKSLQVVKKP